jgi:D-alanyl-D-alanine carboxypeptidase
MTVREIIIDDLVAMQEEIESLGMNISILSAYRSYDTQVITYNHWVSREGLEAADRASARPGHSEHQLGTTIDITTHTIDNSLSSDFGITEVGLWLAQNSYRYGFVLSYPPNEEAITGYIWEPWHFRYVGRTHAKNIHDRGLILDVYLRQVNGAL